MNYIYPQITEISLPSKKGEPQAVHFNEPVNLDMCFVIVRAAQNIVATHRETKEQTVMGELPCIRFFINEGNAATWIFNHPDERDTVFHSIRAKHATIIKVKPVEVPPKKEAKLKSLKDVKEKSD